MGHQKLHDTMRNIVQRGDMPGMVTLVANNDGVQIDAHGVMDIATGELMQEDTIFRIQSMTKPLTAVATLQLIERSVLALDSPIARWLPELSDQRVLRTPSSDLSDTVPAKRPITVEDLLTCRSGYGMVIIPPLLFIRR